MAKNKQSPLLAAFQAKLEAEFHGRLACNTEIGLLAMLFAGNNLGFIGERRGDVFLAEVVEVKMQIAEELLSDAKDDADLEHTKADLARRAKQILGKDGWNRCKQLFPLLYDYWEG